MKKILVFGMTENPGGVESFIMNYYKNINGNIIHFDFLCSTHNKIAYEDEIIKNGSKIFKIMSRSKNYFKYKKELNYFFKEYAKDYDCIWINENSLANIDYLKLAKKYGIKKRIIHSHNSRNMSSMLRGILHKINKNTIEKYATDFWACSKQAAKWFYDDNIISRSVIINNAINIKHFMFNKENRNKIRKQFNLNDSFVVGHIGRLHFQKNQLFILNIFKEFIKQCPNSKLVLIGDGEDKYKLLEKAKSLNILSNCLFVGIQKNIDEWISSFDVFLFPSLFEGLGIALLEAQANGLPILASLKVIPQEVKLNGNFIFYDLKENAEKWAEQLLLIKKTYTRIDSGVINNNFTNNGYNINIETKRLETLLCS